MAGDKDLGTGYTSDHYAGHRSDPLRLTAGATNVQRFHPMNNATPHENYERFLKRMAEITSGSIVPKAAMYDYFTRAFSEDGEGTRRDTPLLYYLIESLETDLLLGLAKLIERKGQSSLQKLINTAEGNRTRIQWKEPMPPALLASHKEALDAKTATIDAITGQRNKYYAHADRTYFFDPDTRHIDYPITNRDIIELVRTFQNIVADHMRHFDGHAPVSVDHFFSMAADQMLAELRDAAARRSRGRT